MYIDKYLSWDYHISELCKKLNRANGIISKLRHNAPLEICLQVYYAIFYSHLIYGCSVWGLTSEVNLKKVEVLQNKCARIITFADFRSHANPLFIDLKLVKVRDIIKSQQLKLAYDFYNNSFPVDLHKLFNYSKNVHTTNVELNSDRKIYLFKPCMKTVTYGLGSIRYRCADLWNSIFKNGISINEKRDKNVSIDQIFNVHQFKRILKKHYLYTNTLE